MEKHSDGSVTLTAKELAELAEAYTSTLEIFDSFPTALRDFYDTADDYIKVVKWGHLLEGKEFDPWDFDEDAGEDEDEEGEIPL